MAKMGRPKAEKPKDQTLKFKATVEEKEKIEKYAETHNLTITQLLRQGLETLGVL